MLTSLASLPPLCSPSPRHLSLRPTLFRYPDPHAYCMCVIYATLNYALAGQSTFLPTILTTFGYTGADAQVHTVYPYLCAFGVMTTTAFISDKIRRRGYFVAAACVVSGWSSNHAHYPASSESLKIAFGSLSQLSVTSSSSRLSSLPSTFATLRECLLYTFLLRRTVRLRLFASSLPVSSSIPWARIPSSLSCSRGLRTTVDRRPSVELR